MNFQAIFNFHCTFTCFFGELELKKTFVNHLNSVVTLGPWRQTGWEGDHCFVHQIQKIIGNLWKQKVST